MLLSDQPQLFVDFERVAHAHPSGRLKRLPGVTRSFHAATVHPHPVLWPERPWEQHGFCNSVIFDEEHGLFRMWYSAYSPDGKLCYATSRDGIEWERPSLGRHEYDGSRDNNIVIPPSHHEGKDHWETVLMDSMDPAPSRRYKTLAWSSHDWDGPRSGIYSATSPDGLDWTHSAEPIFRFHPRPGTDDLGPVGDANTLMVDTLRRRYVAFLRFLPDRAVSTSEDFVRWTPPVRCLQVLNPGEEFYNHSGFVYGDQYLGVLSIFDVDPQRHRMYCELISSRDGERWERCAPDTPLIACGGVGEWNRFMTWNNGTGPCRVGDQLYFYFRGSARRHGPYEGADNSPATIDVGLATMRRDGFASLDASFNGGEVVTTPWEITGGELRVNAKCDYGEVRVELMDEEDRPLPGYSLEECAPLRADGVALPARWRSHADLSGAAGKTVRLRFRLVNARLY